MTLGALNNTNRYDLHDALINFFGDDNEENIFVNDIANHKYYDINVFTHCFKNECIFLSLNICSLMSKFNKFSNFLANLSKHGVSINVIALQEIWNIPYNEIINIPGYNLVYEARKSAQGGGVAFYIKNCISYKIIKNLSNFVEREFECLTVEAVVNKKKLLLCNIYKPPNPPVGTSSAEFIDNFINNMDTQLSNLALYNSNTYVFLDSNVNLLKINNCQNAARYLETIYSNGYNQKIGKATRIIGDSFSLIDHILYKSDLVNIKSGTILTDFSDHFTNFICIPLCNPKNKTEHRFSRDFSLPKIQIFKNVLTNLRWKNVLNSKNVNESFNYFSKSL